MEHILRIRNDEGDTRLIINLLNINYIQPSSNPNFWVIHFTDEMELKITRPEFDNLLIALEDNERT